MKILAKQRGLTLSGFMMGAILFIFVAMFGMKLIPAYMENGKIQKAFEAIVRDPAMQTAPVSEIKSSYYKRANTIDTVTAVMPDDLVIGKDAGSITISASYSKKIPLAGNISVLIEFNPSAPK
jgi:hypothetical protein